jgi:hypothetical protein
LLDFHKLVGFILIIDLIKDVLLTWIDLSGE